MKVYRSASKLDGPKNRTDHDALARSRNARVHVIVRFDHGR